MLPQYQVYLVSFRTSRVKIQKKIEFLPQYEFYVSIFLETDERISERPLLVKIVADD